jgi:hypothetical protein
MRSLAVRQLSSLTTPVDRVVLGRKYKIGPWLRPAYQAICEREEWLSEQEGERLGLRDVLKIGHARQLLRAPAVLREEEERRSLLGGVFADHLSSTADDIPPSRLAVASEDGSVQQSLNPSSSVWAEDSLPASEVAATTTDASDDASGGKPTDNHYEATLGPVYAPVTSSMRQQLLIAVSEIDSAEEAMSRARVDQQSAAEGEANAMAQYSAVSSRKNAKALDEAQNILARAQTVTFTATKTLENAYDSFVATVSPYCTSLSKSYRITHEARGELSALLAALTEAERQVSQRTVAVSQVIPHVEHCRAHEKLRARMYLKSQTKDNGDAFVGAQHAMRTATADAQEKKQQEEDAKDTVASAHLALATSLSKLIADAIAHGAAPEATPEAA